MDMERRGNSGAVYEIDMDISGGPLGAIIVGFNINCIKTGVE